MRFSSLMVLLISVTPAFSGVEFEPWNGVFVTRGGPRAILARDHVDWRGTGIRMDISAGGSSSGEALDPVPGRISYFVGNDPSKWRRDIRRYARVRYRDIYPKVDIEYHSAGNDLEFDFVLAPGASSEKLALRFDAPLSLVDGSLIVRGRHGEVRLHRPVAWQEIGGRRALVAARFRVRDGPSAGIEVGAYNHALPLIIDPTVQIATYYGGATGNETSIQMVTDPSGNVYLAGATDSVDLPEATFPGSPYNRPPELLHTLCFLTRMHPDGATLDYAIYFGGSGGDAPISLIRDNLGFIHVLGSTNSPNFPVPSTAWRTSILPSSVDGFWAKFDPQTGKLLAATFLGVNYPSYVSSQKLLLAVDSVGEPFFGGNVPPAFSATTGAFFTNSSAANGFLLRLNATGTAATYATLLPYGVVGIAVDATGGVLFGVPSLGSANSTIINPLPGTSGQTGGYIARMNPSGSALTFGSYLGGSITGINQDPSGNMHIIGTANPLDVPITNPVHLGPAGMPVNNAPFWVELQANTNTVLAATSFSDGSPYPVQFAFLPNGSTCMLVIGNTFQQSTGAVSLTATPGGGLTCLDQNGVEYFTTGIPSGLNFIGAYPGELPLLGFAPAPDGGIWIAGQTGGYMQTTPGVFQQTFAGGYSIDEGIYGVGPLFGTDAGVMKLSPLNPTPTIANVEPSTAILNPASLMFNVNGSNFAYGTQLLWNGNPVAATITNNTQISVTASSSSLLQPGTVTLTTSLPAPGGGVSNPVTLQLLNPSPSGLGLSPPQAATGSSAIGLQIWGTNILPTSSVTWDGQPRTSTYSTQYVVGSLETTLSASDLAVSGVHTVAVTNPAPGGGSASALFTVTGGSTISLSATVPVTVFETSGVYGVLLHGTGLSGAASSTWDGTSVPSTVNGTSINLAVPAQLLEGQSRHVAAVTQGGQTASTVVYVAVPLNISANPVADSAGQKIYYLTQPSGFPPSGPSSLVTADFGLRTLNSVTLTSNPTLLAITDDGSFVYMMDTTGTVYRYNTSTATVDFQFKPSSGIYGPIYSLSTLSGQPDSTVAQTNGQLVIFDHGVPRPNTAPISAGSIMATTSNRAYVGSYNSCLSWYNYDEFGFSGALTSSCDPSVSGLQQDSVLSYISSGSQIVPVAFASLTQSNIFPDLPDHHVLSTSPAGISDWNLDTLSSAVVLSTQGTSDFQLDNTHILILDYTSAFVFNRTNP